eukprot:1495816-Karenia_brevis.AAC.1
MAPRPLQDRLLDRIQTSMHIYTYEHMAYTIGVWSVWGVCMCMGVRATGGGAGSGAREKLDEAAWQKDPWIAESHPVRRDPP